MLDEWIRPNRIGIGLGLLLLLGASADAQQVLFDKPLSPRIANYEIDVQLLPESRTLKGKQVLTWHNKTGEPINELQFHLYLNAFRNSRSTFMIESAGVMRGEKIDEEGWGFIEIDRIRLSQSGGEDQGLQGLFPINAAASGEITEAMEFIQPDDGNEHDKTVFRLPLPMPLEPGKAISLDFEYTAMLPTPPFARTGAKEEYFFVGQWFPKIGVYEGGQWNCHQFHANSEFFADFGVYDVRITLPREFIVGATGLQVDLNEHPDGTVTHYYRAEDLPLWAILDQFVGRSLMGADIAERIDAHFIMELVAYNKAGMAGLVQPILFIVAIHWLVSLFMSAGALAVLASGERYQPAVFWGAAGKFFGRFLRLALWSLLLLAVVSMVPLLVLGLKRLIYGPDPYEYISYWGFWIAIGLALPGLFFSCIAMDYARIQAVLTQEKRMRVSLWRGIRFTFEHLGGTVGLASLLFVAGVVALAIYQPLSGGLSGPTPILVGMLFLLQQLYVAWRMALRLTRYASELELYQLRTGTVHALNS